MNELLKIIVAKIKEVHSRVYLEISPPDVLFPYVTFNISGMNDMENREDYSLEVDMWDDNENTTSLETLTDNIDKKLNRLMYFNEKIHVKLYRTNRLMIEDTNPQVRHRQLRYVIQTYFLE